VSEHYSSVHLILDPTDAGQLHIGARQHPEHLDTFFVEVDSLRCHLTISGQAEPLLAVVDHIRTELAATLATAGRRDLPAPALTTPATTEEVA
jgi:hypothetical protein